MKFLVDAQLPIRLVQALDAAGHDARHTTDLPNGNRSTDREVAEAADAESRVVITKDADFRDSHLLSGAPRRLLVVATGNIANTPLLELVECWRESLIEAFEEADFVELHADTVVVHSRRP